MGKAALLLMISALIAGAFILYNAEQTNFATLGDQADRQEQIVAREVARTGYNTMLAKARAADKNRPETMTMHALADEVNGPDGGLTGPHDGGHFEARMVATSPSSFTIVSTGFFGNASHVQDGRTMESEYLAEEPPGKNRSDEVRALDVEFVQSMAGFCAGIYVERLPPEGSQETYQRPELLFRPGNKNDHHEGRSATYDNIIMPGETVNFIMSVDPDCNKRNQHVEDYDDDAYHLYRRALRYSVGADGEFSDMKETLYAIVEPNKNNDGVWRIAWEDLWAPYSQRKDEEAKWTPAQYKDIKANGYPTCSGCDSASQWDGETWGGTGWATNHDGYNRLQDWGQLPDFSDQVIEAQMRTPTAEELAAAGVDIFGNPTLPAE